MATATATLNKTKNDLSEGVRGEMVELLQARLADAIDLALQSKQAHWNVKGPNFIALHELFDKVHGEASGWVDETAERLVSIGGIADGRASTVAGSSTLKDYPPEIQHGKDHVAALSTALAAYGKAVRAAIETADKAGDADTADLFTQISRCVDQYLWFVESHNH